MQFLDKEMANVLNVSPVQLGLSCVQVVNCYFGRVGNRERGCWTFFFVFGRCDFAVIACRNGSNCCAEFRFG